jgi:hypothetical protein
MPEVFTLRDMNAMPVLSDRQFGDGLWGDEVITYEECVAFVSTGTIPAALQAIINQLPDDTTGGPTPRKSATILIKGAKEYRFDNPLVEAVRMTLAESDPKWTPEYLAARWRAWSDL